MPTLTVRHVTTYRYRKPVAFGEHRMMLQPLESPDVRLLDAKLDITPTPSRLGFARDDWGNHQGFAEFSGRWRELRFESAFRIEHVGRCFSDAEIHETRYPFTYNDQEAVEVVEFLGPRESDPEKAVRTWAARFTRSDGAAGAFAVLKSLNRAIYKEFSYRRREAKGIQSAAETLRLGQGSCRDFAVLMIEAARSLGFAARFASGYLAVPFDPSTEPANSPRGATHAWAQICLPRAGWIDFDPTSDKIGRGELIPVAVVSNPQHALPLHGTYFGSGSDFLGMEVEVTIREAPRSEMISDPRKQVACDCVAA